MGMLKEFKEFAMKGNLVDIAVGFVMGAAFKEVVNAFTDGIVSPLIGLLFNTDMKKWKLLLKEMEGPDGKEQIFLEYGTFLTALADFIIIAFVMFLFVKAVNSMKKKEEEAPAAPPEPSNEEKLLTEIRDLLKK